MSVPSKHKTVERTNPRVSVLLPNLNNQPFLKERIHSILAQTLTDWELVIVDSYSEDGAWELIQEFARQDSRIRASQAPRGMYKSWNHCIRLARGEYIYIAPSDDTMMPDCLDKMVQGLDTHPECDICHSLLKIINERGKEVKGLWNKMPPMQFYGELMNKPHIRYAPYDGLLYCAIGTVYISITQLLIRRSVFDRVGLFGTQWGSIGDFEWGMRAALVSNTLHLPEILATWRVHSQQETNLKTYTSSEHRAKLINMVKSALPILQKHNPECYAKLNLERLLFIYRRQQLRLGLEERDWKQKGLFGLNTLLLNPRFLVKFLTRRGFIPIQFDDDFTYIRQELKRLGLEECIKVIEDGSRSQSK